MDVATNPVHWQQFSDMSLSSFSACCNALWCLTITAINYWVSALIWGSFLTLWIYWTIDNVEKCYLLLNHVSTHLFLGLLVAIYLYTPFLVLLPLLLFGAGLKFLNYNISVCPNKKTKIAKVVSIIWWWNYKHVKILPKYLVCSFLSKIFVHKQHELGRMPFKTLKSCRGILKT